MVQKVLLITSGTTWTTPSDWNASNNTIICIGGGGGGSGARLDGGGGGGAVAFTSNINLAISTVYTVSIGSGGSGGASGSAGTNGGIRGFAPMSLALVRAPPRLLRKAFSPRLVNPPRRPRAELVG